MTLVEFAELMSPVPLSDSLKKLLSEYENSEKESKDLFLIHPKNVGRECIEKFIQEWKMRNELKEYRCAHCGRLLGRFNGQAEVKCPKCGKLNVIEV